MTDSISFRQCLGKFATGVTVVTCTDKQGRPCGITANSFSSVSLEPPLILWNIAKVSNSLDAYLEAEHFVVNVLSSRQEAISSHFARSDHTQFDGVEFSISDEGVPVLPGTIATFECRSREVHDCGDHHIIVGEVVAHSSSDGDPLLFYGGDYRRLDA
jgi:flavin reductase (DIM6/NTAB) family NADH-FMN oxidoreductase RutF